jgi:hypothetical protein
MTEPKPVETALAMYASARSELIERIRLRDQVLLLFIGAAAALFGTSLSGNGRPEILLALPFVSLGASLLVCQHNDIIGSLSRFCALEIGPHLLSLRCDAPQWDNSEALRDYRTSAVNLRTFGHLLILVTPAAVGLVTNYQLALAPKYPYGHIWWASLIFTLASVAVLILTHRWRQKSFGKHWWNREHGQAASSDA